MVRNDTKLTDYFSGAKGVPNAQCAGSLSVSKNLRGLFADHLSLMSLCMFIIVFLTCMFAFLLRLLFRSQELLDAVVQERNLRLNPPRNAAIFHHPVLGEFEIQHVSRGYHVNYCCFWYLPSS